jgi:type IV pilus assembly protein PilF
MMHFMILLNSFKVCLNKIFLFKSLSICIRLFACIFILNYVAACANVETASNSRADLVTSSDETDTQKRAKIRLELALGYLEQGQTNVALDEVKLAIVADPRSSDAFSLRGLIYMRLNDYGLARDSFNRGLQINPVDGNIFHNLGWLSCQENRFSDAAINFDKALAIPNYAGAAKTYLTKGICLLRSGDLKQAENNFLRSFELDAGNPIATFNLANLLYKRNDLIRSQFYIRRLNNNDYANSESLWLAIKIEKKIGNAQTQIQLADRLKKQFPTSREFGLFERGAFDD